jgi:hypothetical protein
MNRPAGRFTSSAPTLIFWDRDCERWRSEDRRYKFKDKFKFEDKFKDKGAQLKLAATNSTAKAKISRVGGCRRYGTGAYFTAWGAGCVL